MSQGTRFKNYARDLVANPNFAFVHKGDRYFFAPDHYEQDRRKCYLYLGFKNDRLAYAFPSSDFYGIEKDYRDIDDPNLIKVAILDRIKDRTASAQRCFEEGSPAPDTGQGIGVALMLFPLVLVYLPIPFGKYLAEKHRFLKISQKLRLGMRKKELPAPVQAKLQKESKGGREYFRYQDQFVRAILYFEQDQLNAWSVYVVPY